MIWAQRKEKFERLKQKEFEDHKNRFGQQFFNSHETFFINLILPKYPCSFDEFLEALSEEEIFTMNMIVFYVLNDLSYVNIELREKLENEVRQSFKDVPFFQKKFNLIISF